MLCGAAVPWDIRQFQEGAVSTLLWVLSVLSAAVSARLAVSEAKAGRYRQRASRTPISAYPSKADTAGQKALARRHGSPVPSTYGSGGAVRNWLALAAILACVGATVSL
ncbi:hypothetical protein DS837_11070 [Azospirillum brasilense]|uniref:Uncharacterized protein n=1 Tax=Azospirillum brasilense TaxID=192 RepID=A0A6L3B1N9_AZOBR|nr:hypothetical protein DS837_11070 [Azospirillum brasilense]